MNISSLFSSTGPFASSRQGAGSRIEPGIFDAPRAGIRKILAIEIAGLGDLVHSLPSLWALRQHYPNAELHCLVQQGNAGLLELTPWIDRVIAYRRSEIGDSGYYPRMLSTLRRQRYDLAVDLIGADHSSVIAGICGAKRRLIRQPGPIKNRWAWRWAHTDLMNVAFGGEPMYRQRLRCLEQSGMPAQPVAFEIAAPGASMDATPYIHISPYTKLACKELPPRQMARLITQLALAFPGHRLVLSCSAKPRELAAMRQLASVLPPGRATVLAGQLDIPQLLALIASAALHIGGDTGTLHLAWLAGTPSVSWFRQRPGLVQWIPQGPQHQVLLADAPAADYLHGVNNVQLIALAKLALRSAVAVAAA
jgi:heptosyltransferase-1